MNLETRRSHPARSSTDSFCSGNERFTEDAVMQRYRIQGEVITLEHLPDVFPPSAFGLQLGEHLDFADCRRAIDIGTGTGLFAILAARKGVPEVKATDVSDAAVALASRNAHTSGVAEAVEVGLGPFFAGFDGSFDVAVANLPQEILPPGYQGVLNGQQLRAIDGGGDGGNAILLDFLNCAPDHMGAQTRLYTFVDTLTDYARALSLIEARFRSRLLWDGFTATKSFVRDNIAFFQKLNDAGTISIVQDRNGRWQARQMIFELRLR
jgi:methylase of polypeptide subunit release factors